MNRELKRVLKYRKNSEVSSINKNLDLMKQIANMSIVELIALRKQARKELNLKP